MSSLLTQLAAPFPPATVSWRVGAMTKDKARGMALAYIDARDVQGRLDAVCGPDWQVRHPWAAGGKLACEIGIKIDGEWIWRGDGAGDTDVEAEKGAFSDSFKRAGVMWGIGRYLYEVASPWVELEQKGNTFVIPEREIARLRQLLSGGRPALAPPPAPKVDSPSPRLPASGTDKTLPLVAIEARLSFARVRRAIQDAPDEHACRRVFDELLDKWGAPFERDVETVRAVNAGAVDDLKGRLFTRIKALRAGVAAK